MLMVSLPLRRNNSCADHPTAVLQVASSLITDDVARLVDDVKDLVGETDFSFTVSMSESSIASTGSDDSSRKGKRD